MAFIRNISRSSRRNQSHSWSQFHGTCHSHWPQTGRMEGTSCGWYLFYSSCCHHCLDHCMGLCSLWFTSRNTEFTLWSETRDDCDCCACTLSSWSNCSENKNAHGLLSCSSSHKCFWHE